ncbi:MAG: hypothetical protein GXO96_05290 [Nitrospirae bacterium]|nr:hypothetical protein [Candidatus Manganitrophaceae bacterium]
MWNEVSVQRRKSNSRYFIDETRASYLKRECHERGLNSEASSLRVANGDGSVRRFVTRHECLHIESLGRFSAVHTQLDDPDCVFILTDVNANIVELFASSNVLKQCRQRGITRGASLSADSCGINAVSQALHDRKPVALKGRHHFLGIFQSWCCFAVPIFGPKGEVIGCVDCSMGETSYLSEKIIFTRKLADDFSKIVFQSSPLRQRLAPRQKQMIQLLEKGWSSKEVAAVMGINPRTIETMLRRMRYRFRVKSNIELVMRIVTDSVQSFE